MVVVEEMKTYIPKKDEIQRKWWLVDAEGKTLGRLATRIASLLRGKQNVKFTPFLDTGDFVVVINAEKVSVTGEKKKKKVYRHHSGYIGGLKEITFEELLKKKPEKIIQEAVWGMLPKNRLGRTLLKKLKVYRGPNHPHQAQVPDVYPLEN